MLRWYHEDGTPHLCDVEACESVAAAMLLYENNDDQVVWHYCELHVRQEMVDIDEHMKMHHPIHYYVDL